MLILAMAMAALLQFGQSKRTSPAVVASIVEDIGDMHAQKRVGTYEGMINLWHCKVRVHDSHLPL